MKQSNVTIEGIDLDLWPFQTILKITIPGSLACERASIARILLTEKGELVFITKPYPDLANKEDDQHEMATNRNCP